MLVSKKVIAAINGQIGMEFAASIQYDAIGAHFDFQSLPRLSRHFYNQSTEERGHAHRFMKFVLDAGAQVVIPAIEAPISNFKFAKDAVKLSLEQEIKVTDAINGLYDLALKENDHITVHFFTGSSRSRLKKSLRWMISLKPSNGPVKVACCLLSKSWLRGLWGVHWHPKLLAKVALKFKRVRQIFGRDFFHASMGTEAPA